MRPRSLYTPVEGEPGKCQLCGWEKDTMVHYIPARTVEVPKEIPCIVIKCCKACKVRVFRNQNSLVTLESQINNESSGVRERSDGYVPHKDYDPMKCGYCGAASSGLPDYCPSKKVIEAVGEVYGAPRIIVNSCKACKNKVQPKNHVLHTFEARATFIKSRTTKLSPTKHQEMLASLVKPWEVVLYDDEGTRHVTNREEAMLTPEVLEEKRQWLASQAQVEDHVSEQQSTDDIIEGWLK